MAEDHAIAFSNRALAYNNQGDHERAIADLTRAIGVDPIALGDPLPPFA